MEKMARMIMIETEPTDTPITIPVFDGSVEGCKRPRQRCCPASVDDDKRIKEAAAGGCVPGVGGEDVGGAGAGAGGRLMSIGNDTW